MESPARESVLSSEAYYYRQAAGGDLKPVDHRLAVILPCYNEEAAIARVVSDFRLALPTASVYVFDNNSTDRTAEVAEKAGAVVLRVNLPGKGNVVRRMFADVDADIYVMADGDATYHAPSAPMMIRKLLRDNLDMVVGIRSHHRSEAYRRGHRFGNRMLTRTMTAIFGSGFTDMLSGYRVFSRRFVKSFPAMSKGFEIETELTIHALELRMPSGEMRTPYGTRPNESESKLRTYADGLRILKTIVKLFAVERPFRFYSLAALMFVLAALILAVPLLLTYADTGFVPRFPTAILSTGLSITGVICFITGVILETVTIGRREIKQLHYLSMPCVSKPKGDETRP
ncbi:MAG: glycosyltransferase [Candidatus Thiodiazotropha sp. (ex Ctena orbiculata)]|uniref:Glycosyltransferase n=1 Tax=Candidatus Thiodiazotropha taylori TaxID=2792791 RepID=A0A944M3H6_9GAMM|nr:glycosyltransferase [Candidatus Thiodiazotropha taylori]PUB88415.1 MAG: glycosyl transferase [gamma proteobacterium symbiont of Ctena orbiculata]MBT2987341.1 glycosyltransferase [Candidatus Thiodiazotropha taylori]MBT2995404.1 glycosyltransferase [Candidatus Thiodiazotropha taylori]MBT3028560.1 glycosyltransferase [Candidatus Thiodiazotropha taylori]